MSNIAQNIAPKIAWNIAHAKSQLKKNNLEVSATMCTGAAHMSSDHYDE